VVYPVPNSQKCTGRTPIVRITCLDRGRRGTSPALTGRGETLFISIWAPKLLRKCCNFSTSTATIILYRISLMRLRSFWSRFRSASTRTMPLRRSSSASTWSPSPSQACARAHARDRHQADRTIVRDIFLLVLRLSWHDVSHTCGMARLALCRRVGDYLVSVPPPSGLKASDHRHRRLLRAPVTCRVGGSKHDSLAAPIS